MSEEVAQVLLTEFIATFVPFAIMQLEQSGGLTPEQQAEASNYWLNRMDEGGLDELFYRKKGQTARTASALVQLIACLAFETGGVEFFGHHFVAYEREDP